MNTKITILGCGSSIGSPVLGCSCNLCFEKKTKNIRTRSSILIQHNNKNILIDTGPDIKQQLLREKIKYIDSVLYTHRHIDHIVGAGELAALVKNQKRNIDIYSNADTLNRIKTIANFMFFENEEQLNAHLISFDNNQTFSNIYIDNIETSFKTIKHGNIVNLGISLILNNKKIVYLNDISSFDDSDIKWLQNSDLIIIDAKEYYDSKNHFGFPLALKLLSIVKPEFCLFTNLSHNIDYYNIKNDIKLSDKYQLCYDGMQININNSITIS